MLKSKLSPLWRRLIKGKIEEGDFRDWNLIIDWTKKVTNVFQIG